MPVDDLRTELAARDQAVAQATADALAQTIAQRYAQAGFDAAVRYYTGMGLLQLPKAAPDADRTQRR